MGTTSVIVLEPSIYIYKGNHSCITKVNRVCKRMESLILYNTYSRLVVKHEWQGFMCGTNVLTVS